MTFKISSFYRPPVLSSWKEPNTQRGSVVFTSSDSQKTISIEEWSASQEIIDLLKDGQGGDQYEIELKITRLPRLSDEKVFTL